jgi:hypothetical protein
MRLGCWCFACGAVEHVLMMGVEASEARERNDQLRAQR